MSVQSKALSGLAGDERGSIAILSAAFVSIALAASMLAVDLGSLYLERRQAQSAVDLAAIAAANDLDHREKIVRDVLAENGVGAFESVIVTPGHYAADSSIPVSARFVAGAAPYNAVHVALSTPGRIFFARVFGNTAPTISVEGLAASQERATFSIGSRLLAVRSGLVNKVLSALVGGNVELSVMDYEALASADIEVGSFLDALASSLSIRAGTYQDVLDSNVSLATLLDAAAQVGNDAYGDTSAEVLAAIAGVADAGTVFKVSQLIDIGDLALLSIGSPAPGLDATVDALRLLQAAAVVANGEHQVALDVGADIPGIAKLALMIAIGERPVHPPIAIGPTGTVVRTAQLRLRLLAELAPLNGFAGIQVRLPIDLQTAWAEASLDSIRCNADRTVKSVGVAARPGIIEAWIGSSKPRAFGDFSSPLQEVPATLVDAPLVSVSGFAHAMIGNRRSQLLEFDQSDIEEDRLKRVETSEFVAPLVTTLVGDLQLRVKVLGLALVPTGPLTSAIADVLAKVATPLDAVLASVLQALGVHLGEADVRVHDVACGRGLLAG